MDFFYNVWYLLLIINFGFGKGARILGIFIIPAKSHFTYDNAIMKPLIDAGHEVTIITPFPEDASKHNYSRVIDVSKYAKFWVGGTFFMEFIKMTPYEMMTKSWSLEQPICNKFYQIKEIKDILNSKKKLYTYDAVFVEMLVLHKCFYPIAQKLEIPLIGTVSFKIWLYSDWAIDNPINPSYMPLHEISGWEYDNFYRRLMNSWYYIMRKYFWNYKIVPILEKFHQDNLQEIMSYSDFMRKEPEFLFYNNHPIYNPRPNYPNVVYIGGIHIQPAKPLPKDIQKFIDEAENGVILFSFGSVVKTSSMTPEMIHIFKDALGELPQRVIWKFEDHLDNMPDNVLPLKWLPQRDILEHKNVIAFMSHCGQSSTYEAIYSGTPVISCPLFSDQPGNAARLEHLEVAVHLDIHFISKEKILRAINTLLNNTKYRENMKKLSQEFKDRPMTPEQSVVYWTQYIIKHNEAPHFKTAASQLNWSQYSLLDVLLFAFFSSLAVVYFTYRLLKSVNRLITKYDKIFKNRSD